MVTLGMAIAKDYYVIDGKFYKIGEMTDGFLSRAIKSIEYRTQRLIIQGKKKNFPRVYESLLIEQERRKVSKSLI